MGNYIQELHLNFLSTDRNDGVKSQSFHETHLFSFPIRVLRTRFKGRSRLTEKTVTPELVLSHAGGTCMPGCQCAFRWKSVSIGDGRTPVTRPAWWGCRVLGLLGPHPSGLAQCNTTGTSFPRPRPPSSQARSWVPALEFLWHFTYCICGLLTLFSKSWMSIFSMI